jgi:hypothetical protein
MSLEDCALPLRTRLKAKIKLMSIGTKVFNFKLSHPDEASLIESHESLFKVYCHPLLVSHPPKKNPRNPVTRDGYFIERINR